MPRVGSKPKKLSFDTSQGGVSPWVSTTQVGKILRTAAPKTVSVRTLNRDLQELDIHTPVGPLFVDLKIAMIDGEPDLMWLVQSFCHALHPLPKIYEVLFAFDASLAAG